MYMYTSGYENRELTVPEGRTEAGNAIGMIRIGTVWAPTIPGDIVNKTTFAFPVCHGYMRGDFKIDKLLTTEPDPVFLEDAIRVGRELEQKGCRAIVSACGYFANYLKEVSAALTVPTFLSSLMQVPIIIRSLKPNQKVGIICADGRILAGAPALKNCGIDPSTVVIAGAENLPEMQNYSQGRLNPCKMEQELVNLAKETVKKNPEVAAFLLECSLMPAYAWAIQRELRLPVFDFTTLINWVYNAVVRRPFAGFM